MQSPVFEAKWSDGTVTRMSVWCKDGLDLGRAVRLSWHAYDSRHKGNGKATIITTAHFERDGVTLETYKNLKPGDYFSEAKP
jgi:hypothetical protein